jgi:aspartyl-tRNA(Asn)/glutamyl-tRNA(Gln) amidotransferase subunit B
MEFTPVIGLEIHVELKTKSKMFCQCSADFFGKIPNSQVCPVCLGLPGALPVPNKRAIEWTILLAKALNCQINKITKFDRKHYFYPDLPKGYQISQYDEPIGVNGHLSFIKKNLDGSLEEKNFRIGRVHLEEDTGKLIHEQNQTLIDFNRSGVPLIEIVTEPDFTNSEDVKDFLEELHVLIRYLGISDADMEKGSMRLEPNISIKKTTTKNKNQLPNYKVEIKNINSFRFVKKAVDYEIKRQIQMLKKGINPQQETRGFDEKRQITYSQRKKEEAHDYRYFPEPDIPPIVIDDAWLNEITKELPELPNEKLKRYINILKLRFDEAFFLTRDSKIANYFERVISLLDKNIKLKINDNLNQYVSNLIVNKKLSLKLSINDFANKVIELLKPKEVNTSLINQLIDEVIKENPKPVVDYKKGKQNAIMFLVGLVLKKAKGQADAKTVIEKLKQKINEI